MPNVLDILDQHIPSITPAVEAMFQRLTWDADEAEYAIRECSCGTIVNDFYDYHAHLRAMIEETIQ